MPEVSVIIPNYNHAPYLNQRIDSVLKQGFQNFELIILDDCSTDDSRAVIEGYRQHPKVAHIVYNETNSGNTFRQWEKGLLLCTANLVWIAESDDAMDSSFLEKAVAVFKKDDATGIFQCGSQWINEQGNIMENGIAPTGTGYINGSEFILTQMQNGNGIYNASAVLFNKKFLQLPLQAAIKELSWCGDWLFWIKILEHSNLFILNENLNSFRRHSQNVSGKATEQGLFFLEGIKVYGYIKKQYPAHFKFINNYDKTWAYRFMAKGYPLKTVKAFVVNSLKAGLLIPVYVAWFKIKMLFGILGNRENENYLEGLK